MIDTLPVRKQLHNFIEDLEKSIKYEYNRSVDCDSIVLSGMGGSAISGNVVADYCLQRSHKPVVSIMNASLPNWVNKRTLVVISSYSGNTLETIESYKQALGIGCEIVVITSGGILKSLAEMNNNSLILLPNNMHPRHSIGYMIGYIIGVIKSSNFITNTDDIFDVIESLKKYRDELEDKNSSAMKLAKQFIGYIPVICSYSNIQSIIFRWKTQFNENSKYVAFCTTISEFVYSDLKGWINNRRPNYALTIIIENDDYIKEDIYLFKLIGYLRDHNVPYRLISLGGRTYVENMMRALMLGDYISMYMAEIQGIDPSGVPPITLLKQKLKPIIEDSTKELLSNQSP